MEIEKYIFVKKHAYKLASYFNKINNGKTSNYTIEQIVDFLIEATPYDRRSEEFLIFISTILLPNDIGLINLINNGFKDKQIRDMFDLPINIIISKHYEIKKYNLEELIKQGRINEEEAGQNINVFSRRYLDVIDIFDAHYQIENEKINDMYHKQRLLNYLNKK